MKRFRLSVFCLLLLCGSLSLAQESTYGSDTMGAVTIQPEEVAGILNGFFDVKRFAHSLGIGRIARDERLETYTDGFLQRNGISVLTIGYIDGDRFWPKFFRQIRLKKINKAETDLLLAAKIIFVPQETDDGVTGYTVRYELTGKTTQVYELLQVSLEMLEAISLEAGQELSGGYATPGESQDAVVNALIAALQRVEAQGNPQAASVAGVTFQPSGDQVYGFDAPIYEQLNSDYPVTSIAGKSVRTSWKSLKSQSRDPVVVSDPAGQALTFEQDGVPVSATKGENNTWLLAPMGTGDQQVGELVALAGEATAGILNVISYDQVLVNVKIVPVNGAGSRFSLADLQQRLDVIYAPAIAGWQVEVLPNVDLGMGWDLNGDGRLNDGETGMLSNYTDEMDALISAFRRDHDRDSEAYYVFLVDRPERAGKLGYMPRKKQWGFVFAAIDSSAEALVKTIAHELGHGVFRLEHPFSERGLPKGQTDNLMDYADGTALYKYQWDFVHDPASVMTLFDDEEEAAMEAAALFVDYDDRNIDIYPGWAENGLITYVTPSGIPFILPETAQPSFTGLIKNRSGETIDLGIPRGVLMAFRDETGTYGANFSAQDGTFYFRGYRRAGSEQFKEISNPARNSHNIIIGQEDASCRLYIITARYDYTLNQENAFRAEGFTVSSVNYYDAAKNEDHQIQLWDCFPDYWTWLQEVPIEEFETTLYAKYNFYGQGGVLQKTISDIYLYSAIDDLGNHGYFQWTGNKWTPWVPPDPECTSCELREMFTMWFVLGLLNETGHTSLDVGGIIPALGEPLDFINGIWYSVEGDAGNATLSFASTVPVVGWASTGGKWALKGAKQVGRVVKEGSQFFIRYSNEIAGLTERLNASQFTDELIDALNADIENSPELIELFIRNHEFADAWKVYQNARLDAAIRTNPAKLEDLSHALKQEGYSAAYFEDLLKSKEDPAKFLDEYVSRVGDDGKLSDEALESDYVSYLSRKAKEGKPARDRTDWNHVRDYMLNDSPLARGNNFNRRAWDEEWYPFWEVYLDNGKYLDGYDPITKEVVSRKATDLVDINESTFRMYLDELLEKYAPPRVIKSQKPGYEMLFDQPLPNDAKLILEIPESNISFYDIDRYSEIATQKGITIKFASE